MSDETVNKRTKVGGRVKGTPNKVSGTAKENIIAVFTRLGSTAAMAKWAADNQTEFYKLYARLLPTEIEGNLATITVLFDDPTQRPSANGHAHGYHRKPVLTD
jgi:hypothetical protein